MSAATQPLVADQHGRRPRPLAARVPLGVSRLAWYALCCLLGATMLLPLVWMLSISLKSDANIQALPPTFFPSEFQWSNYVTGPTQIHFGRLLGNTMIITVLSTIGSVISSMLVAYGLARIEFPGRRLWFGLIAFSVFVPGVIGLIPLQRLYIQLGLLDTYVPLILPAFLASPIFVYLARQYNLSIPKYLDESAMLDGAGHWHIFTRIMLPLTRPAWITIAIMAFQFSWNDYLTPLIYLQSSEKYTLAIGMASFIGDHAGDSAYNYYMATNMLYMLPPLALFFLAQRYFMEGLGSLGTTGK
ncbi:carbohydrate ABC transporter permease [Aestuariimicrobium soli]|uniref:carbohydrate ABC transporter permease n=1 Tax=Aestuariimicrobium soli TaxID=2035834 RepID=UPI003EB7198B